MSEGFYSQFEAQHRGSTDSIKQRLTVYQPLLQALSDSVDGTANGLDLGCGRGEWLAFASEQGLQMTGVDSDPDMLSQAITDQATLITDDALSYLQQCPDQSVHLVSAFHVIEHLPFAQLMTLLQQAQRILKPGGVLLLETPNPENPLIGSCYFYMDPTHLAPLPPALVEFAVQHHGFGHSKLWRLNTSAKAEQRAPTLHTVFNGVSPDYAIVALKPDEQQQQHEALIQAIDGPQGQTLEELATRYDNFLHESLEKQQSDTERLFDNLQRLAEGHDAVSIAVADHQRVLDERQQVHDAEQQQQQQRIEELQSALEQCTHLLHEHQEKLRVLTLPIVLLRPLHNQFLRRRDWIKQLKQSARTRLFYQWQAIKLLRLMGQKRLANKLAIKVGLTAFIPELAQGAATGPLDRSQPMANIRKLSLQQPFKANNGELCLAIDGHFSGSYSLASVNRQLALTLQQQDHTRLAIRPREGVPTSDIKDIPESQGASLRELQHSLNQCDVTIYHHFPVVEQPDPDSTALLLFFWEESQIPADTIAQINRCYRGVLVMSYLVRKALIDSGCQLPIAQIPMPLNDWRDDDLGQAAVSPRTLLHVSSCFPRKGVDVLLRAFDVLAARHSDLTLIIKTFPNPHNQCQSLIEQLVSASRQKRITLIEEDYSDEQMAELYRQASAVVLPSRGEGLNLPAIEACRYGVPVISTGYGAQTDFLADTQAELVNYRFAPSASHVSSRDSLWVDPDVDDLVRTCEASLAALQQGQDLSPSRQAIYQRFYSPQSRQQLRAGIQSLGQFASQQPQPAHNRITLLSTWDERCGIAEYSRYQSDAMINAGMDVAVVGTQRPAGHSGNNGRVNDVSYQWATQTPMRLALLQDAEEPVWIQHHPSFFNLDEWLQQAIARATQAGRLRLITLHTTLPLLQLPKAMAEQTARTLNQFYRVIVHTVDDLNNLRQLGVSDNLLFRPHGNVANPDTLGALKPRSTPWKVGCFGFLFEHKGVLELIEAFAAFRQQQPDAQAELVLINSEHSNDESARYRGKCQQRIRDLGLEDCTTFKYQFLPEEEVALYLSQCDLLVMPYRETPESSSGAVRIAVANCQTVAVTPARIFSEVRDVTLPLAGFDSRDIEQLLLATWRGDNQAQIERCQQQRVQWLQAYSWEALAQRHIELIRAAQIDLQWLRSTH